jgi:hypothetical protein
VTRLGALRRRHDGILVSIADDPANSGSGFTQDERNELLSGYGEIGAC